MSNTLCPCGSSLTLATCCAPYHEGQAVPTAEALVRARYSAFCLGKYEYIVDTTHPDFRDDVSVQSIASYMKDVIWQRLEIRQCDELPPVEGQEPFSTVTFSALYEQDGNIYQLSETSYFQNLDGKLYYVEGMAHRPMGFRRTEPKVGRNDACPCGSGKKFKKCCMQKED